MKCWITILVITVLASDAPVFAYAQKYVRWDATGANDRSAWADAYADLQFADPRNGNLRLSTGSPAINAGDNAAPYLQPTDLDGQPRVMDGVVDMGAYEYDPATNVTPVTGDGARRAQNYPNPFNPTTTIEYSIARSGHVTLKLYNVAGQLVRTLVDETQAPGQVRTVRWYGRNNAGNTVSSGVYLYRLESPGYTRTRKMVIIK